jgi:pyridoxine 4-dehydrogenase
MLARAAADLLGEFTLSTKVGYFPSGGAGMPPQHSLEPARLRQAVEQSVDDLGRRPDVVFLHNPEHTLGELPADEARDRLDDACLALVEAAAAGLCETWGIASWDPRSVVDVVSCDLPPTVVMIRAGLSVRAPVLIAAEKLCQRLDIPASGRWGMSPFGGSIRRLPMQELNLVPFMPEGQRASTVQSAFRLAYEVPRVTRVAVGTTNAAHLQELVAAADLDVSDATIQRYRWLLDNHTAATDA